jgi:response regulator RpfG family c-di-GMP phosphodiesterase
LRVRDVTGGFGSVTTRRTGTILLATPDPELLHILEVNLLHANLNVIPTGSGAEALTQAFANRPDMVILDTALPDIDVIEVCRRLKESPQTSPIPVVAIGARGRKKGRAARPIYDANNYIAKPFDPHEVVTTVLAYLRQKERAENTDPSTGLANQVQVDRELAVLIEQNKTFAVMYTAMEDLKAVNRIYGFAQGDLTIRLLANIVSEAARLFGNPDDLVAHHGGDRFTVITTPYKARNLCRRITADFNRRIKALYAGEHLSRGYHALERPDGRGPGPEMSLHIAIVTNQKRTFYHYLEVGEAAAEQMEHLKHLPGNVCYFDLPSRYVEPTLAIAGRAASPVQQKELEILHGILAWLDFIIADLIAPLGDLKNLLETADLSGAGEPANLLARIKETVDRIGQAMEAITDLNWAEQLAAGTGFEEVDIGETLDWIVRQVSGLAERRQIRIKVARNEGIDRFLADRRGLTQALLYLARAELATAPLESNLHIDAAEINDDFIAITFSNRQHHVPERRLSALLLGQPAAVRGLAGNELYPAKLLAQAMGGRLSVSSGKEKGIVYTLIMPRRWQSQLQEVNALKLAAEISRKEARVELRKIQEGLAPPAGGIPAPVKDSVERLRGKVQELGVLCNRALFLTDDLGSQLELQQDQLSQREQEQLATAEALAGICRETAHSMGAGSVFDPASIRRVVNYALAIANELKISNADRQAMHHAALLKDLGLLLSPREMVARKVVPALADAVALRTRFNQVWKELSVIPFLSLALVSVIHLYERWDGGGPLGIGGEEIPLGARILAVADALDAGMAASGRDAGQAIRYISDGTGLRFDPEVVNAMLHAWRMKKIGAFSSEVRPGPAPPSGEVEKMNTSP